MTENRKSELASKRSLGTLNKSVFNGMGEGGRIQTTDDTSKESEPMRTVFSLLKTAKIEGQIQQQHGGERLPNEKFEVWEKFEYV